MSINLLSGPKVVREMDAIGDLFFRQFVKDYLNRFNVLPLRFSFAKSGFLIAGEAHNNNLFHVDGEDVDIQGVLCDLGIESTISIGGDFVIGHDYAGLTDFGDLVRSDVGLSIFDTANHGYDSLFLASHIRSYVLNMIDAHLRHAGDIKPTLFEDLNDMMRGPITRELLDNTLPLRQRSHGAVGIHGQMHTDTGDFNFFCAGLPLFYYSSTHRQFIYLEPDKGPPLGYFANKDVLRKRYVPHNVQLQEGDYLILATDGCFESEWPEEGLRPVATPDRPVLHYRFPANKSMDVMSSFNQAHLEQLRDFPIQEDPAIASFCGVLQPLVNAAMRPGDLIGRALKAIRGEPFFTRDDRSLIVVQRHLV